MNKTKLVVSIVIVCVVVAISFSIKNKEKNSVNTNITSDSVTETNQSNTEKISDLHAVFTDPSSKEVVTVIFDTQNNTALLTGAGYTNLKLDSAVSASGARYLDSTGQIELWNKGENITLSKDGKSFFSGNSDGQSNVEKMTLNKWVWQATSEAGKVTEPKNKTAFTITFNTVDKTINATTDCNTVFGPYTVEADDKLNFSNLGMTRKFCEGSQETEFASGLSKVRKFSFNGSGALVLEFSSAEDYMLFGK